MKHMLVGYLENLSSDWRIIATSRMRMDILYFVGYDLDKEFPWHSTLNPTCQLYGEQEFMCLFKLVLKQCKNKALICGKRQAIDSEANASMPVCSSGKYLRMLLLIAKNWSPIAMKNFPQLSVLLRPIAQHQKEHSQISRLTHKQNPCQPFRS